MRCCGKERYTRYCADCGRLLYDSELSGLLAYCLQHVASVETQKQIELERARRHGESQDDMELLERRKDKLKQKWQTWADELQKLLTQQEPTDGRA